MLAACERTSVTECCQLADEFAPLTRAEAGHALAFRLSPLKQLGRIIETDAIDIRHSLAADLELHIDPTV